ncbi:hypothetical protein DYB28_002157 [Aphanomyces astaci]|uniref:Tf2-1-like SH3-like domain-containing protein n=1 Tax=Aphanomyces astaci TaxID=112090 RepID=A0A9X8DND4_APHAT|nr:hypothetical protein DYB28_002157 [Aphanomyces astaci]
MQQIHDSIAAAQQRQSTQANKHGRSNITSFAAGDQVLLHKSAVPAHAFRTRAVGMSSNVKLRSAWHGPFTVLRVVSPTNYKLYLPNSWKIHPTFALPPATSAPPLAAAPQPSPPPPDNPRLLAAPPLSIDHPVVAPAADCTPQTDSPAVPQTIALPPAQPLPALSASSRAHVEELAVGEAHTLDQALAGSTENPLGDRGASARGAGVNRAPCTSPSPLTPEKVNAPTLPIAHAMSNVHATAIVGSRWTATGRQFAVRVGPTTTWHLEDYTKQTLLRFAPHVYAGGDPRDRPRVQTPMLLSRHPGEIKQRVGQPHRCQRQLPMPPAALSDKRPHKRYKELKQCIIIA